MFGSWILNEIRIIDLSSALVGMLTSSSNFFLFSNEAHLNSGVRLLMELFCECVRSHVDLSQSPNCPRFRMHLFLS